MMHVSMDGILIVDKPQGRTSHDVVDFVRRRFSIRKVGHAGTLDPLATGVLVVLLGQATKQARRFMNDDKEYDATLRLGITTDSGDAWGKVLSTREPIQVESGRIEQVFQEFRGEILQIPPMVSALKYKGRRLYKLAREGKVVPRLPRRVTLHELAITEIRLPWIDFHLTSSKGTYVRTLCHDIGERLGCGAHMSRLMRVRSGGFRLSDGVTIPELERMGVRELAGRIRIVQEIA
ncbi:MAG: tRNA pseudouridine(55) synthase TruB [Candidatus Omnitrophica bacterium]|nr:tRNA pseudouridine(55) synthase TruB [Candidatus Omnitrophota bacterium]